MQFVAFLANLVCTFNTSACHIYHMCVFTYFIKWRLLYKYHHSNSIRQRIDTFSSIKLINISDVFESMNLCAYSNHSNELSYTMCKWIGIFLGIQLNVAFSTQKCGYFGWLSSFITFSVYFSVKSGHIFNATIIMSIITTDCTILAEYNNKHSATLHLSLSYAKLCNLPREIPFCTRRSRKKTHNSLVENWSQRSWLLQQLYNPHI